MKIDNGKLVEDALAYFCIAFKSLGVNRNSACKEFHPKELLQKIHNNHQGLIFSDNQMNFPTKLNLFISKELPFLDFYDIKMEDGIIEAVNEIAETVIGLYSCTGDFFVLHAVTSCFALKQVLKFLHPEDQFLVVRFYMRAIMVTYIVQNQPKLEFVDPRSYYKDLQNINWERILQEAIKSNDVHVIKFVWTTWKENIDHNNDLYFFCASQKSGLLSKKKNTLRWPFIFTGIFICFTIAKILK